MQYLIIREPIWKDDSISINDKFCKDDWLEIEIAFTKKNGERLYPGKYYIHGKELKTYPIKFVRQRVKLRNVPIEHLHRQPTGIYNVQTKNSICF